MRRIARPAGVVLAAVAVTAGLAACGGDDAPATRSTTSTTSASTPTAKPLAAYPALSAGTTSVKLDPSFTTRLAALGLHPTAVAPATFSGPTVSFPVSGGSVSLYRSAPVAVGTVKHSGGLALTARGATVALTKFVLTLGAAPTLAGSVLIDGRPLGSTVTMFDVDTTSLAEPVMSAGSVTLSNATVYVDPTAAGALNAAFGLTGTKALPTTAHAIKVGTATSTLRQG